ncbi:hypothetical protein SAMD00019534_058400 [Acytostelium subglobosum LB1]|uniref:hypothetical protein n=1 Tax=Acytostelium subglobosum LB1 TaxID=1410327 RepID=UPI0006451115|nr:hypothetical protein SAMD00019534_058400 [Acytostelium subglobosum LB1]GAM22665.1 hypothetical protein SAMD00019534_058400 [Acytostelium subglobosum LB1]|eukprot:XP_012754785.1 hypothetical protein SAMD00019534_058400 [Acytostelium subglobosum LB1]
MSNDLEVFTRLHSTLDIINELPILSKLSKDFFSLETLIIEVLESITFVRYGIHQLEHNIINDSLFFTLNGLTTSMLDVTMALVDMASINNLLVLRFLRFLFDDTFLHGLVQKLENSDHLVVDQIIKHYANLIIAILIDFKLVSQQCNNFYIDLHKAYDVATSILGSERLGHSLDQWFLTPSPPECLHSSTSKAKLLYLVLIKDKSQSELYLNVQNRHYAFE